MASLKAKNRLKKAKKDRKQKLSFRFVPTRRLIENFKKIDKKFRKFKNTIVASFQAIIGSKGRETGKIKIIIPFRSNPMRHRKFIKNCKKIQKIRKIQLWLLFKQNWLEKAEKKRKYKLAFRFVPTQRVIENSKQIVKKFKKL